MESYSLDADATAAERRMIMSIKCLMNGLEVNYPCSPVCALFGDCLTAFEAQKKENVRTNADRIRSMSDEEMAQEMIFFCPTDTVFKGTETYKKPHYTGLDGRYYSTSEELVVANLEWLQQPEEEVTP